MMRAIIAFSGIFLLAGGFRPVAAAEPAARELISPNSALLVEINRPLDLLDSPLSRDVWELIRETNGVKQGLSSPKVDKFRQAARFIEKSLGADWRTGVNRLTAGGIVFAVAPQKSGGEPVVTAVVTADDEATLKQFIEAIQAEMRRAASSQADLGTDGEKDKSRARASVDTGETSYRSFVCNRVGNGHYSLVGRQLLASNSREGLEAALDRLAGTAIDKPFNPPASLRLVDNSGKPPMVLATVNLKLLKEDPKAQAPLTFPANDPVPVVLLGGYLDLFRRADFAAAGIFVSGPAHELKIRVPVGTDGAYAGLRGYFASETTESAPRLLRPTGTILTTGWFRDYKKLWDARSELVNPEIVAQLEAANTKAQSEGAKVGLADLVQMLGPHFRFVVARPQETVYTIKLEERLPAFALVVSVRDETGFRQRVLTGIDSLLWLGAASANLGEIKPSEYRGAKINTLRFSEKPEFADSDRRVLYNFTPSYSLTRGELIVGSTAEIVRDLIDELDRQAAAPEAARPADERPTDRQQFSFAELSEFLKDYVPRLVRGAILDPGLSPAEAEKEIDVLRQVLLRLGQVTASTMIAGDHFEISIQVGPVGQQR
jgi:hypothetical protein